MKAEESLLPALDGFFNPELTDAWLWGRSLVLSILVGGLTILVIPALGDLILAFVGTRTHMYTHTHT